jgi:hypothetical protein
LPLVVFCIDHSATLGGYTLNAEEAQQHLRDYLLNGIAAEIYWADEAYALAEEIGKHAEQINAGNFNRLFGSLQLSLSDRQTLSVTKIFDPVSRRYPTRSIPATLELLETHAELWEVPQRHKVQQTLTKAGVDSEQIELLHNTELTRAIVAHYRSTLPNAKKMDLHPLSASLEVLKSSRDKVIAHNEAIERSVRRIPTWGDAVSLVNYAKEFVATIGFGYLNIDFGTGSNDYYLASDVRRSVHSLRRLLRVINTTEGV